MIDPRSTFQMGWLDAYLQTARCAGLFSRSRRLHGKLPVGVRGKQRDADRPRWGSTSPFGGKAAYGVQALAPNRCPQTGQDDCRPITDTLRLRKLG